MRQLWRCGVISGLGLLLVGALAGPAGAVQYLVTVSAGDNGDSHGGNNDDPDAHAEDSRAEMTGSEFYEATANTNGGQLHAHAARMGSLSNPTSSPRSVARIEETLHIDEVPTGPLTITATLGVDLEATADAGFGGIAKASAGLSLDGGTGNCAIALFDHNVSGFQDLSNCSAPGSSAAGGVITLVLTPQDLANRSYQIDIDAQVDAGFEGVNAINSAVATASGGTGLSRGAPQPPARLYLELDPPLAHHFTGSQTFFLVPEPGAPLLLAAGAATLGVAGARGRRRR